MSVTIEFRNKAAAVQAWHQVFCSENPFGWPFCPAINDGRILFPTDGCHLSREQFDILAQVVARSGETHCYLAVVEGSTDSGVTLHDEIFALDFVDYDGYARLHLTLENAIYSVNGTWGLLLSHEMHAVLGGSPDFVTAFNQFDGSSVEQWQYFEKQWSGAEHAKWLAEIAPHVNKKLC